MDDVNGFVSSSSRPDEGLRESRGCHGEPVGSVKGLDEDGAGRAVVCVIGVEEPDDR